MAACDRMRGRDVVDGTLGCPVCKAEYRIRDGVARFDAPRTEPSHAGDQSDASPRDDVAVAAVAAIARAAGMPPAMYLAALLDLAEPGGVVLLEGSWCRLAPALEALRDARLLLLDPPADADAAVARSVIRGGGTLPVAASSLRAAALASRGAAGAALLPRLAGALSARGRLVAAAELTLPAGVRELARDSACWVAERTAGSSAPVGLARAPRGDRQM